MRLWPKRRLSKSDLAQLRICEHGTHQIDERGIGVFGDHLTTCPTHKTYNPGWARERVTTQIDLSRLTLWHWIEHLFGIEPCLVESWYEHGRPGGGRRMMIGYRCSRCFAISGVHVRTSLCAPVDKLSHS